MLDIFADAVEHHAVTDELVDQVFPDNVDGYDELITAINDGIESLTQQKPYYQWTVEELLDSQLYQQLSLCPSHRQSTLLAVLEQHVDDILAIEDYIYHEYRRLTVFAIMRLWLGRQWGMSDQDGIRLLLQWRRDDSDIGYSTLSWGDATMLLAFVKSATVPPSTYPAVRSVIRACVGWHSSFEAYRECTLVLMERKLNY